MGYEQLQAARDVATENSTAALYIEDAISLGKGVLRYGDYELRLGDLNREEKAQLTEAQHKATLRLGYEATRLSIAVRQVRKRTARATEEERKLRDAYSEEILKELGL